MRTTIRMNEELARRAKAYAARTKQSFTEVVETAVAEMLAKASRPARKKRIVLPVAGDPNHKVTENEYRAAIEEMYEQEAEKIINASSRR